MNWTVSRIAEHLGTPRTRVDFIIKSRRIDALDRVGVAKVFNAEAVDRIRAELEGIDRAREARGGTR